jgi:branched-chain amino acid transport system substrate-binding protein
MRERLPAVFGILLSGALVLAAPHAAPAAGPINIGVNLELSGPQSDYGTAKLRSIQLIVDEINKAGGIRGQQISLEILDNKSDPTQSALNTRKLIGDGVVAILGAGTSPTVMPTIQYAEKEGVPMVADGAANQIVEPVNERKWIFKSVISDSLAAERAASWLQKHGLTSVAFLQVNSAYGDSGHTEFGQAAARHKLHIVDEEKFGATDPDVTSQLTKIKNSKAQAVLVWATPTAAAIVAKNAAQLSMKQPMVYGAGAGGTDFTDLAQQALNGAYMVNTKYLIVDELPRNDSQRKLLESYISSFKQKFNHEPDALASFAADSARIIVEAIRIGGSDRASIRSGLEHVRNFPSYSGRFNITPKDHQGLTIDDLVVAQYKNGHWVEVK